MREKLDELARLLEAAKIGTVQVEGQTVYSLENGCNDVWFGVNIKGNHSNHAARRVAAAKAIAGMVNAFPALLEYVRGLEAERDELRDRCELYRLAATAREPEPQVYTTGGTWETPALQAAKRLREGV